VLNSLKKFWPLLPMLLLASGPPVFRQGFRASTESMNGKLDVWSMVQVGAYGLAAVIAVLYLLPRIRIGIPARHGAIAALATLLVATCALSGLWAVARLTTVAYSLLMGSGLLIVAQFANSVGEQHDGFMTSLYWLQFLSLVLGVAVLVTYQFQPGVVAFYDHGLRVRGGNVAVLGLCGTVGLAVSAYRMLFITPRWWLVDLGFIGLGGLALYYARTRGLYVATGVSLCVLIGFYLRAATSTRVLYWRVLGVMIGLAAIGTLLIYDGSWFENLWSRGSTESITNLSSRTYIWGYTIAEVFKQPWGFGYTTGFRDLFDHMNWFRQLQFQDESGMPAEFIGEAHNSHLEFLVGPGWIGFFLYLALLWCVFLRMCGAVRFAASEDALHAARLCLILFFGFIVDGMTASAYALPLHQPFGYLLFVCALALGVEAFNRRQMRLAQPELRSSLHPS
jgi:O-antigen ligase